MRLCPSALAAVKPATSTKSICEGYGVREQVRWQGAAQAGARKSKRAAERVHASGRAQDRADDQPHSPARNHAPIGEGRSSRRMRNRP